MTGKEVLLFLERAEYVLHRIRHRGMRHNAVEKFLDALSSFRQVDQGILGFDLAENWEEILMNFRIKFIPVLDEYCNTGND